MKLGRPRLGLKQLEKQQSKREEFWDCVYADVDAGELYFTEIATKYEVHPETLRRRLKKREAGDPFASGTRQGQHLRVFSDEQEIELGARIRRESQLTADNVCTALVTSSTVQLHMRNLYRELHPISLRSDGPEPKFSKSLADAVAVRLGLSVQRVHNKRVSIRSEEQKQKLEGDKADFVGNVIQAIAGYGADWVLNFDETPCKLFDVVGKALGITGSDKHQSHPRHVPQSVCP